MLMTDRLKASRKACKLTQQQVADMLSVDRSTYAYYELGVSNPPLEKLSALAALFKCDVSWLLGEDIRKNMWSAPENELDIRMQIKELGITELSGAERMIVGLYRIAEKNNTDEDFVRLLKEAAGSISDEDKE